MVVKLCEVFNGKAPIIDTRCLLPYPVETDSSMSGFGCVWKGDFAVGSWSKEPTVHADIYVSENHWASGPEFVRDDPDIICWNCGPYLSLFGNGVGLGLGVKLDSKLLTPK